MGFLTVNLIFMAFWALEFEVTKVVGDCKAGSQVTAVRFSDTILNHTIVGPVMSSITAKNDRECEMECHLADPNLCYMFNYHPSSKVCELLYKHRASEYKVERKDGSLFKTRKCISNPCLPGDTCFSLGNQNNNSCIFMGKMIKSNKSPVCVGAKDDSYGTFFAPENGKIKTFKLVHISGGVYRSHGARRSGRWGNLVQDSGPGKSIDLLVTDAENSMITPPQGYPMANYNSLYYNIPGLNTMSPELVFPEISPPLDIGRGKEFRIWFGQDLTNITEENNGGETCADVYVLYSL